MQEKAAAAAQAAAQQAHHAQFFQGQYPIDTSGLALANIGEDFEMQ